MAFGIKNRWLARTFGPARPAARGGPRLARLAAEALEAREVPVANLFVDFGAALPTNGLAVSVAQLRGSFAAGGLQGPNLVGTVVAGTTLTDASTIVVLPFGQVVTAFDYNGDGAVSQADLSALQGDIVGQVAGHYAPFDVAVSAVANSSAAGIRAQMQANNGLAAKKNDAYALVAGFAYEAGGVLYSVGAARGALGEAPEVDLVAGSNTRDDTVAVYAEQFNGLGSAGVKPGAAFVTAHETGHSFGLRHTSRATADNRLLADSDIMSTGGGAPPPALFTRTDNFFTRFTLPYAEPWADGKTAANAHDQLAADPDIGPRPGAAALVTGTGAFDRISIAKSGAGAVVTVQAYRDAGLTSQIGTAYTYTIPSVANGVRVEGGAAGDTVFVGNDLATGAVIVSGGTGYDTLAALGSAAADSVTLAPAPAGGVGTVTVGAAANKVSFDASTDQVNYATEGGGAAGAAGDTVFVLPSTTTTFVVVRSGPAGGLVTVATYGTSLGQSVTLTPAPAGGVGSVAAAGQKPVLFDSGVTQVNYATAGGADTVFANPSTTTTFAVLKTGAGAVTVAAYGSAGADTVNITPAPAGALGSVTLSGAGAGLRPVLFDGAVDQVNYATAGGADTVFTQPNKTTTFVVLRTGAPGGTVTVATFGTTGDDTAYLTAASGGGFGTLTVSGYKPVLFDENVDQVNYAGLGGVNALYVDNVGSPRTFAFIADASTADTLYYRPAGLANILRFGVETELPY